MVVDSSIANIIIEWDASDNMTKHKIARQSRGLGDSIAKMAKALGVKPCAGCGERQEALNKAFSYASA